MLATFAWRQSLSMVCVIPLYRIKVAPTAASLRDVDHESRMSTNQAFTKTSFLWSLAF